MNTPMSLARRLQRLAIFKREGITPLVELEEFLVESHPEMIAKNDTAFRSQCLYKSSNNSVKGGD